MSTTPFPRVRSTPLERAQAYVESKEPAVVADPQQTPFYLVGFRNRILRLLQGYFSRTSNFPTAVDLPDMSTLTFDPHDARKIDIRVTLAETPPSTARCIIWVRTPGLSFDKIVVGDRSTLRADMMNQELTKSFTGELVIMADHSSADVATMLLEGVINHIEGTKALWMADAGLQMLDVTKLEDGQELSTTPDRSTRSTVRFAYQGRLNLVRHTEALILKRHVLEPTATAN